MVMSTSHFPPPMFRVAPPKVSSYRPHAFIHYVLLCLFGQGSPIYAAHMCMGVRSMLSPICCIRGHYSGNNLKKEPFFKSCQVSIGAASRGGARKATSKLYCNIGWLGLLQVTQLLWVHGCNGDVQKIAFYCNLPLLALRFILLLPQYLLSLVWRGRNQ